MDCGEGVQTRHVFCGVLKSDEVSSVEEVNCDSEKRFSESQPCNGTDDCEGSWFSGPWSEVSDDRIVALLDTFSRQIFFFVLTFSCMS